MKTYINDNKVYVQRYEGVEDFFYHTDLDRAPSSFANEKSKETYKEIMGGDETRWRYGSSRNRKQYLEDRSNPQLGKEMCIEHIKKVTSSKEFKELVQQALTYKKRINFVDNGHRIDVAKAIAGDDKYFISRKNSKKPTVRIGINLGASGCVDTSELIEIAKKAIPTIYALETAGIATEVDYMIAASGVHSEGNSGIESTLTSFRLKSAQERFNWTTFAPTFTSGTFRESIFLSWVYSEYGTSYGLGRPMGSSEIKENNNFGYDSIIGYNGAGMVEEVQKLFKQLKFKK